MVEDVGIVCPGADCGRVDRGRREAAVEGLLVGMLGDGRILMENWSAIPSGWETVSDCCAEHVG